MRLPVSKIYRAFVELDPFTDSQCIAYMATAKRRNRMRSIGSGVLIILGMILIWVVSSVVFGLSAAAVSSVVSSNVESGTVIVSVMGIAAFGTGICGLLMRDKWLRWMIRSELKCAQCPGCDYSLLGLRVEEDVVICPECGNSCRLEAMGLTPADLIAEIDKC